MVIPVAAVLGLATSAGAAVQYKHPKLHHWYASEGGKQSINAISTDETAVGTDANANNTAGIGTDCQNLLNDIQIAQTLPTVPLASANRQWSAALRDYNQGATNCVNGINDNDANGEIEQATSEFTSGNALLNHLANSL